MLRDSKTSILCFIFIFFMGYTFPAWSADYSFVEINFSFMIGLSLTYFISIGLLKQFQTIKWHYPLLSLLILSAVLLAIPYSTDKGFVLGSAALFITINSIWPLNLLKNAMSIRHKIYFYSALTAAAVFIVSLLILPQASLLITWLSFSVFCLAVYALTIALLTKRFDIKLARLTVQWLMLFTFSMLIYKWIYSSADMTWLVVPAVLSYFMALINAFFYILSEEDLENGPVRETPQRVIDANFSYTHDHATQLPSYQQTLSKLHQLFQKEDKRKYAIIVFKPINFQQVNSVLGHHNSDILLLQLAYCLQQHLEGNELLIDFEASKQVSRIGKLQGLNFIVAFDVTDLKHPEKEIIEFMCQQITNAVPDAMSFKSFSLNFELAFGVAMSSAQSQNIDEFIAHAGDALLEAESTKSNIRYFDNNQVSYTEQQLSKMELLKEDIVEGKLHWVVQPQIKASDRSLKGFELLVYWQHKNEEPQELQSFASLAEYSGEIYLLTKLMLKEAFIILGKLQQRGLSKPVSINLVSKHLLEAELVDYIEQQMSKYDVLADNLIIELTEDVLLTASEKSKQTIDQLRSLGIKISIDNFTGSYESLRYVRKMSINQVKVDCKQLTEKEDDKVDTAIVHSLINLSGTMQLPIIGVGIDSHEVERIFIAAGGSVMQGEIINKGVALNEFDDWLIAWFDETPITVEVPITDTERGTIPFSLKKNGD